MDVIDKSYIIDASVILAGLLLDEVFNRQADRILENYKKKAIYLSAPTLLSYEVINGIRSAFLRKRILSTFTNELVSIFQDLRIELIHPNEHHILTTSLSYNLSIYDSAYISVATQKHLPLLTADKILYHKLKSVKSRVIWIEDYK